MKIIGFVVSLSTAATTGRERVPSMNLRGRCGFGQPCDSNRLSYGCEKINEKIGFCWSECVGNMPSESEIGSFVYEGWCYNINSSLIAGDILASFFSGKVARVTRDADDKSDDWGYQEYFDNIGDSFLDRPISEFTQCSTDDDCKLASRACAIGCGNKEEVPLG